MLSGDVLTLRSSGTVDRWHVGKIAALIRPRVDGGAVVALEHTVVITDQVGGQTRELAVPTSDPAVRINEGGCDPDGRLYCGTAAYDGASAIAALYRIDAAGTVDTVCTDVTISNGLEWNPAGTCAYYVDTPTGRVDRFSYSRDGGLGDRETFVEIPAELGTPDGLAVDAEDGVWVALWGGSRVHRYDPHATLDTVVELPVTNVTACTFGGADLGDLFITTSRIGASAESEPLAGALFHLRPGVRGLPTRPFNG
jgi:sugar lactone lactonase YvrE